MSRPWLFRLVALAVLAVGWWLIPAPKGALVVYCSQDARHALAVFTAFTRATGIEVTPRFDTEATKSMGLVEQLRVEGDRTPADVFWNNQLLGTLDVEELLQPHQLPAGHVAADLTQDPGGRWIAFGARVRGTMLNRAEFQKGFNVDPEMGPMPVFPWDRFAVARREFGTTRSHFAAQVDAVGLADAQGSWPPLEGEDGNSTEVAGNSHVAELVAAGACAAGFTDSDDFFAVRNRRDPGELTFEPLRIEPTAGSGRSGGVLVIPNTVGILANSQRPEAAREFVRFLTGPEGQRLLAAGSARQLPTHPAPWEDPGQLPEDVCWLARKILPQGAPASGWTAGTYRWADPRAAAAITREHLANR